MSLNLNSLTQNSIISNTNSNLLSRSSQLPYNDYDNNSGIYNFNNVNTNPIDLFESNDSLSNNNNLLNDYLFREDINTEFKTLPEDNNNIMIIDQPLLSILNSDSDDQEDETPIDKTVTNNPIKPNSNRLYLNLPIPAIKNNYYVIYIDKLTSKLILTGIYDTNSGIYVNLTDLTQNQSITSRFKRIPFENEIIILPTYFNENVQIVSKTNNNYFNKLVIPLEYNNTKTIQVLSPELNYNPTSIVTFSNWKGHSPSTTNLYVCSEECYYQIQSVNENLSYISYTARIGHSLTVNKLLNNGGIIDDKYSVILEVVSSNMNAETDLKLRIAFDTGIFSHVQILDIWCQEDYFITLMQPIDNTTPNQYKEAIILKCYYNNFNLEGWKERSPSIIISEDFINHIGQLQPNIFVDHVQLSIPISTPPYIRYIHPNIVIIQNQQILYKWLDDTLIWPSNLFIQNSKIGEGNAGKGLFTNKLIKQNTIIGVYFGIVKKHNENKNDNDDDLIEYGLSINTKRYTDASHPATCAIRYANTITSEDRKHNNNSVFIKLSQYPFPVLVAIKDIQSNDEIYADYGFEYDINSKKSKKPVYNLQALLNNIQHPTIVAGLQETAVPANVQFREVWIVIQEYFQTLLNDNDNTHVIQWLFQLIYILSIYCKRHIEEVDKRKTIWFETFAREVISFLLLSRTYSNAGTVVPCNPAILCQRLPIFTERHGKVVFDYFTSQLNIIPHELITLVNDSLKSNYINNINIKKIPLQFFNIQQWINKDYSSWFNYLQWPTILVTLDVIPGQCLYDIILLFYDNLGLSFTNVNDKRWFLKQKAFMESSVFDNNKNKDRGGWKGHSPSPLAYSSILFGARNECKNNTILLNPFIYFDWTKIDIRSMMIHVQFSNLAWNIVLNHLNETLVYVLNLQIDKQRSYLVDIQSLYIGDDNVSQKIYATNLLPTINNNLEYNYKINTIINNSNSIVNIIANNNNNRTLKHSLEITIQNLIGLSLLSNLNSDLSLTATLDKYIQSSLINKKEIYDKNSNIKFIQNPDYFTNWIKIFTWSMLLLNPFLNSKTLNILNPNDVNINPIKWWNQFKKCQNTIDIKLYIQYIYYVYSYINGDNPLLTPNMDFLYAPTSQDTLFNQIKMIVLNVYQTFLFSIIKSNDFQLEENNSTIKNIIFTDKLQTYIFPMIQYLHYTNFHGGLSYLKYISSRYYLFEYTNYWRFIQQTKLVYYLTKYIPLTTYSSDKVQELNRLSENDQYSRLYIDQDFIYQYFNTFEKNINDNNNLGKGHSPSQIDMHDLFINSKWMNQILYEFQQAYTIIQFIFPNQNIMINDWFRIAIYLLRVYYYEQNSLLDQHIKILKMGERNKSRYNKDDYILAFRWLRLGKNAINLYPAAVEFDLDKEKFIISSSVGKDLNFMKDMFPTKFIFSYLQNIESIIQGTSVPLTPANITFDFNVIQERDIATWKSKAGFVLSLSNYTILKKLSYASYIRNIFNDLILNIYRMNLNKTEQIISVIQTYYKMDKFQFKFKTTSKQNIPFWVILTGIYLTFKPVLRGLPSP